MVVGQKANVKYIHYTVLIYNYNSIQNSGKYRITTGIETFSGTVGGVIPIPSGYEPYTVMGVHNF